MPARMAGIGLFCVAAVGWYNGADNTNSKAKKIG